MPNRSLAAGTSSLTIRSPAAPRASGIRAPAQLEPVPLTVVERQAVAGKTVTAGSFPDRCARWVIRRRRENSSYLPTGTCLTR